MAEAATKKPPTATSVADNPVSVSTRSKTLRAAQIKKFAPSSLHEMGQDFALLAVRAPLDWVYDDILKAEAWGHVAQRVAKDALNTRRDMIGSLIYVRHDGGKFKAILEIAGITKDNLGGVNGLVVDPWFSDIKE